MKYFAIAAVCVMTSSQALAASEQFDLVCGTTVQEDAQRLRVDLIANEWCRGDCKQIDRIQEVTSGKITFRNEGDNSTRMTRRFLEVNRVTGVLQDVYDDHSGFSWNVSYQCKPATFSEMRKGEAKF